MLPPAFELLFHNRMLDAEPFVIKPMKKEKRTRLFAETTFSLRVAFSLLSLDSYLLPLH
jgi:hypothetical protein